MSLIKPAGLIFICSLLLRGVEAELNCSSPTPESLYNALKNEFIKKEIRPANFSDPVVISIDMTVVGIIGLDEKTQTLTVVIWQVLQWDIEGLSWDENKCGTERFSVLRTNIWTPDVRIREMMEEDKLLKATYVYLNNRGRVYDDKPARVVSSCKLIIYTFPFDIQDCSLTFDSYLYDDTDVKMFAGSSGNEIMKESNEVLLTKGEWELINVCVTNLTENLSEGYYSQVKYTLILRRRPLLYVVNLLVPSCFLTTMDLFSFLLPPQSVDRSAFKMTLILGYTVFLLLMNDLLPANGEITPLINIFFSISLALMVSSLLETVFVTKINFSSSQYGVVPHWLRVLVLQYLAVVVCLPSKKPQHQTTVPLNQTTTEASLTSNIESSVAENQSAPKDAPSSAEPSLEELRKLRRHLKAIRLHVDKYFQESCILQEWQMIGAVIDRLLFGVYIVFITASFITIAGVWNASRFAQHCDHFMKNN